MKVLMALNSIFMCTFYRVYILPHFNKLEDNPGGKIWIIEDQNYN